MIVARVEVSNPDKVLFADGTTKLALAKYYQAVAAIMVPYLADRPISMQRFPDGISEPGFYEKTVPTHFPTWVDTVKVDTADDVQCQVAVNDARSLVYLADQACITIHTWLSRARALESPDQLIFDLDPSVDDLAKVRRATAMTGELLDEIGLTSFVKTTGSRGYHVMVPLRQRETFDETREFAKEVAQVLVGRAPELLTCEQRKANRGDKVYLDVARNGYGQTAVSPYAVRALPGAPVSTPIEWYELDRVAPDEFTVATIPGRLSRRGDAWHGMRRRAHGLDRARDKLSRLS
ncbi:non-homologous end-joining DNA ligase [Mycolicibacterium mengxianglii]|uniref:non-homologous end-joining DNA ligase n=1 Tax=Mycolicibacterium mengxianglii TaxID=2736649 RepID=UPI0018D04C19|nr:non-homologous end-joining DNA ligase [Mycolicibacterium mengxianglii]